MRLPSRLRLFLFRASPLHVCCLLSCCLLSCCLLFLPLDLWGDEAAKPDLDVTYIERTPLYPAYCVGYDQPDLLDLPVLLDPQTLQPLDPAHDVKRQPAPGDKVTYKAYVRNHGRAPCGEWEYQWTVDDKPLALAVCKTTLKVGEEGCVVLNWQWQPGAHRIRCTVDPAHKVTQTTQKNDTLEVATNAWLFVLVVDQQTYDRFNALDNVAGTRSFEDWAQWHIAKMNDLLKSSASSSRPDAKNASSLPASVACNKIVIAPDAAQPWSALLQTPASNPLDAGCDGAWAFGHAPDIAHWALHTDYGLLHEWGHQLGLTDANLLDRQPAQNLVPDESGDPLLLGHISSQAGSLMYAPDNPGFSPLDVAALDAQAGKRRGYYGDTTFAMPTTNVLLVLDASGRAIADARVTAWQDEGDNILRGVPIFSEPTDRQGRLVLPNRPTPHITTPNGFALHDNPFGQITLTGVKDVLLLRIAARGQTDTAWLDVAELNLAYFNGNHGLATYTRRTHIPAEAAPLPPASLRADASPNDIRLTWDAVSGAKAYRVYCCDALSGAWQVIGPDLADTACTTEKSRDELSRYAVVALGQHDLESGFSNIAGIMTLNKPWGITVIRNARRLICDAAQSRALLQKPDGSYVGAAGPADLDMRGAIDTTIDSKGRIISTLGPGGADGRQGFVIQNADLSHVLSVLARPGSAPRQFQNPMGVTVDAHDNIFICDTDNDRVQEYGPDGKFKALIGTGLVKQPHKLAIDKQNNLIICDTALNRLTVLRHDADGVYRLHGHANNIARPVSIVVDAQGRYFISSQGENAVIALDSQFYRLPWKYTGPENHRLQSPAGLALDGKNHLLLVDTAAKRILETRLP